MLRCVLLASVVLPVSAMAQDMPGRVGSRPVVPAEQALPDHKAANVRVEGAIVEPLRLPPDVSALQAPPGYRVSIWAEGLGHARMLAVADDGTVYLTRRREGDVLMLRDTNGDGRAESPVTVARRAGMHGIALDGRTAYLITQSDVYTAPIMADGRFGALTRIIDDLPDTGQHPNRTLAVGGDGMLYITVGSTCNACMEKSPESATIVRATKDGKTRQIYASGLRNTIGFGWHPRTGQMWGLDMGTDWLGDTQQLEELNKIEQGKAYGWPYVYGNGGHNPQDDPPGELTITEWDAMSTRPVLGTDAHAAPMAMAFYKGAMFPMGEQGNAFAAFRGSWNRSDPSGYDIRRVRFDQAGNPVAIEPFVTGFLTRTQGGGVGQRGRLAGVAEAKDGSLLFTDDENGVIYRVAYEGADRAGSNLAPVMAAPGPMEPRPKGATLALARDETKATERLRVTSPRFGNGGAIPAEHSAWYQDVSTPLSWSGAPAGTKSFALLMEDPDAAVGKPFVHWVAWNIPPTTAMLEEALAPNPQIPELGKMRQGRNTRGSIGYFGPRPPIGDRRHRYHFQVFALDTMLDIKPGSDRETLLTAMTGHVLAKGEVVGRYGQPTPPPK